MLFVFSIPSSIASSTKNKQNMVNIYIHISCSHTILDFGGADYIVEFKSK